MFQESNRWIVLGVALLLAACGTEQVGEGAADNTPGNTQDVGTETTDGDTQTDDASQNDTETTDTGTQTDDESADTSDAGTQTDDDSTDTSDAGTQTDDESTDTNDAGTQTDDESTDTSDTTDGSTDTDGDTEVEDEVHDLNGKWEGSYTCSQGFTRLTLQVTHDTGSNTLDAVFAFYADNSNPDVPTGRYTMLGSYNPETLSVVLDQGEWIEQPSGYVMVSLDGFINEEGTEIAGTVDNLGCTEFTVQRGN